MTVVVDASAIGPYLLADEEEHALPGLAEALTLAGIVVPTHWHIEVANLLLMASRRGRLDDEARSQAWRTVSDAIVSVDNGTVEGLGQTWTIAQRYRLTIYDACYLEVAQRLRLPLATNDRAMMQAATAEHVKLFGR